MPDESPINKDTLFASLAPVWPDTLLDQIRARLEASDRCYVVLDDDPTGGQTLHGMPVLTRWSVDLLASEMAQSLAFFVLANTRALTPDEARTTIGEIARNLVEASRRSGRSFSVGMRGDSTLRGHFPLEHDTLTDALTSFDVLAARPVHIVAPYFGEGGRFTAGDVQYVLQGDELVPAAQTEFAHDPSFAFRTSHLPSWIAEKTQGRVRAEDIVSLSIEALRVGGPAVVAGKLRDVRDGSVVVVNAADDRDIEVLVAALLAVEAGGKRFVSTTAASFVRVRAGIARRALLTPPEIVDGRSSVGGLLVVGSYVDRSSQQLASALQVAHVEGVELQVDALLDGHASTEIERAAGATNKLLTAGRDVVLYTSRGLRAGATPAESAGIGRRVRESVCGVVECLRVRPRYLVVKGGSTASDVATRALVVQRAVVAGQLMPGVPVWELGVESLLPGLRYVIFPGNVGGPDSVADVLRSFARG